MRRPNLVDKKLVQMRHSLVSSNPLVESKCFWQSRTSAQAHRDALPLFLVKSTISLIQLSYIVHSRAQMPYWRRGGRARLRSSEQRIGHGQTLVNCRDSSFIRRLVALKPSHRHFPPPSRCAPSPLGSPLRPHRRLRRPNHSPPGT